MVLVICDQRDNTVYGSKIVKSFLYDNQLVFFKADLSLLNLSCYPLKYDVPGMGDWNMKN